MSEGSVHNALALAAGAAFGAEEGLLATTSDAQVEPQPEPELPEPEPEPELPGPELSEPGVAAEKDCSALFSDDPLVSAAVPTRVPVLADPVDRSRRSRVRRHGV